MVMALKSDRFFTEDEKSIIDRTIKEVEKKTSGEIVVMVVDASDRYEDIDAVLALVTGATLSVLPAELVFERSAYFLTKLLPTFHWASVVPDKARFITALLFFIIMSIVLYFPIRYFVSFFPFIKSLFLSERRREREIRERAIRAFHQQGLHNTRDETGILFLISLLERKVYVLADKGIYLKINQSDLDGYAFAVAQGISKKRAAESLCEAIRAIGADLAEHFPPRPDDTNELPDGIITAE
jgi:putative membrane protein